MPRNYKPQRGKDINAKVNVVKETSKNANVKKCWFTLDLTGHWKLWRLMKMNMLLVMFVFGDTITEFVTKILARQCYQTEINYVEK